MDLMILYDKEMQKDHNIDLTSGKPKVKPKLEIMFINFHTDLNIGRKHCNQYMFEGRRE